jgi:outer membrane protein OmpA-like peptidoglycan-associated protein
MNSVVLKRVIILVMVIFSISVLTGCSHMEKAPKNRLPGYWYYHKPLPEADRTLDAARNARKDKKCPAEFGMAKAKVDKAYKLYMACRTEEAMKMAQEAIDEIKALCPAKPIAKMKPKPRPEPTPPSLTPPPPAKVIDMMTLRVNFDFDQVTIRPSDKSELDKAVDFVKKYPGAKIELDGHTDSIGTEAYNQKLSQKRAEVVKKYLIKEAGVDPSNITTVSHGESNPVADNKTKEGRFQNRRTEILILSHRLFKSE